MIVDMMMKSALINAATHDLSVKTTSLEMNLQRVVPEGLEVCAGIHYIPVYELIFSKKALYNNNPRFSPSEGPCCSSETCRFVPSHFQQQCKSESDCSWPSFCNGQSPECPNPVPKANKTRCNEGLCCLSLKFIALNCLIIKINV